jgi:valyl-tRNA synthetase
MKKLLLILGIISITAICSAQYNFMPSSTMAKFSIGDVSAMEVTIYESKVKDVEKNWNNVLKNMNGEVSGNGDETFGDNINYPELSNTTVNMYYRFTQHAAHVSMILAVDLGSGLMSPGQFPRQFNIVKGMLLNFSKLQTTASVANLLMLETKQLKSDNESLEKLEELKASLEKDIKQAQRTIERAQEELSENEENQDKQKEQISKQQLKVKAAEKKSNALN